MRLTNIGVQNFNAGKQAKMAFGNQSVNVQGLAIGEPVYVREVSHKKKPAEYNVPCEVVGSCTQYPAHMGLWNPNVYRRDPQVIVELKPVNGNKSIYRSSCSGGILPGVSKTPWEIQEK